ncbi:phospholipase A [Sphingomonas sp. HF-S4]|uniref:Phospholipase A1 n=1 Tax=Sphingomonas agrestis TaxID=3080540 RepID=A0ABU3YAR9_9SPHN|nr:phospholipase A [Sphingomonas sp. HF-S4]MDV3458399.1 phospholipase A [Sphingomonas sp. HF-S4]
MRLIPFLLGLSIATPAAAQLRAVPAQPASEVEALRGVEVFLVNEGAAPLEDAGPRQIEVTAIDGTRLVLERVPGPTPVIAPGGFAKARYVPVSVAHAAVPPSERHPPAVIPAEETVVQSSTGSSSAFVDRFEPHEPIYGVFGTGDAGGKLQMSFAFRPFAEDAPLKLGNLRFAYTQTMFWALAEPSGPFRSTIYSPEVYADVPLDETSKVALGWRHDSNGRGMTGSIDVNRIFGRVEKSFDLGGDWRLDVAPQAWFYVGKFGTAPDVKEYLGYASLTAAIQQKDGLKLSLTGRGNFETRKGGAELFASYPLARIGGGIGFYLFGQAFTGYGEALDDYRMNDTHARIGIALTR